MATTPAGADSTSEGRPMASVMVSSADPSRTSTPVKDAPIEKDPDEQSKLKTFLGILRRFIGVSDIASVRFSLPAQLLEPTPNLEYWGYLDRPETFIAIGNSEEPLGRILEVLRFWFTKDLKYVKGKPCKPYNSTLGEFFRCNWEVEDTAPPIEPTDPAPKMPTKKQEVVSSGKPKQPIVVSYLTEQTSHHPPVSAFYVDCPEKGIVARGFDQLSAKFTGTSIRVVPGAHNLGIFITLTKRDNEEYQLTHPAAHLGGLLRGSLSVSVADTCFITCAKTRIKIILQYMEEGWLGRSQNRVEGVVFTYDPENDNITKLKDVPTKDVLARIDGSWMEKIFYTLGSGDIKKASAKDKILLTDLTPLFPVPKLIPPESEQLPNESRKFWSQVTNAILSKQYSLATQLKTELEERQRQKATERKEKGVEWQPRFFTAATTPLGKPDLTEEGRMVLNGLHTGNFHLEESEDAGAY
ncbi:hypothetical protein M501DRAFT_1004285 [Patellaria atrata CBS 101060]|uniref:Oxysterol-binding protein-like protein n=1 Tax=Patellaria atrata CBS 101060 TaxID=1346257 RepID=A0A9P4S9G6_9PEZI|nr:hypothetical protein M501DRAFT_1004285 [Patellaria atrata CBS 101060]